MIFKIGVTIKDITKECMQGMSILDGYHTYQRGEVLTITSVSDGKHMKGSKHYEGNAFDVRTWTKGTRQQMSLPEKNMLALSYRARLGSDYDVVVEKTHIHVEYDKK